MLKVDLTNCSERVALRKERLRVERRQRLLRRGLPDVPEHGCVAFVAHCVEVDTILLTRDRGDLAPVVRHRRETRSVLVRRTEPRHLLLVHLLHHHAESKDARRRAPWVRISFAPSPSAAKTSRASCCRLARVRAQRSGHACSARALFERLAAGNPGWRTASRRARQLGRTTPQTPSSTPRAPSACRAAAASQVATPVRS